MCVLVPAGECCCVEIQYIIAFLHFFVDRSAFPVNGTTGESVLLTIQERKTLAEQWMKASRGR